jgi:predicted acyl esterase
MRQQSMVRPQDSPEAAMTRPLSRGAAALGQLAARAWSLPPRRNQVTVERDVQVPMSDGTVLLATHYVPVSVASAATVLVRCPSGWSSARGRTWTSTPRGLPSRSPKAWPGWTATPGRGRTVRHPRQPVCGPIRAAV